MASDAESRKRKSATILSNADVSDTTLCPHCSRRFDEDKHTPRNLACGHTFCTACLGALVQKQSARKWAIACPLDGRETPVDKGDAKMLGKNIGLLVNVKATVTTPVLRLFIRNLAGARFPLLAVPDDTIGAAKRQFEDEHPEYPANLQVWSAKRAAALGNSMLPLAFRVSDGEHIRSFGSRGHYNGQLYRPADVCVSPCGELLFIADQSNNRVQVYHASDGAYVRTIGSDGAGAGEFDMPSGVCLSPDGELLFVADLNNHRVQVLRASDGAHVRTIGSEGSGDGQFQSPHRVCVSPSGEWLFVTNDGNDRVQVFRASDGAHVHSFGSYGSDDGEFCGPVGICVSPGGDRLFVADFDNNRVQVFIGTASTPLT